MDYYFLWMVVILFLLCLLICLIALNQVSNDQTSSDLDSLLEKLPAVNSEVLTYILEHLNR